MQNFSFWSFLFIVSLPLLTLALVDVYFAIKAWYDEHRY
jgi:hypothetical protein